MSVTAATLFVLAVLAAPQTPQKPVEEELPIKAPQKPKVPPMPPAAAEGVPPGVPPKAEVRDEKATIKVELTDPVALVFFDDEPTTSTGHRRLFLTPPLKPGRTFHYRLKIVSRGQTKEHVIEVRGGKVTKLSDARETIPVPAPARPR